MSDKNKSSRKDHRGTGLQPAYDLGRRRRRIAMENPSDPSGPRDDGYETMSPDEKEAYKTGNRGD